MILNMFFKDIFLMWAIFKVFIEFVTVLLLFYGLVFGCKAHGIFTPCRRWNLHPLHWKAKS